LLETLITQHEHIYEYSVNYSEQDDVIEKRVTTLNKGLYGL